MLSVCAVMASVSVAASSGDLAASAPAGERIHIATTVAPITSIVANIVGDRADIEGIVPEGTNSHTFEPRPSVAELLSEVDVVYMNGLELEEPTRELAEANLAEGAEIIELGTMTIPDEDYIYDSSFPESGASPTRTCGPTRCWRCSTPRSCVTTCPSATRTTPTTTTPSPR